MAVILGYSLAEVVRGGIGSWSMSVAQLGFVWSGLADVRLLVLHLGRLFCVAFSSLLVFRGWCRQEFSDCFVAFPSEAAQ